jgi:hypothetical protein
MLAASPGYIFKNRNHLNFFFVGLIGSEWKLFYRVDCGSGSGIESKIV